MYTLGFFLIGISFLCIVFSILAAEEKYFTSGIIFFIVGCITISISKAPENSLGKFHISEDLIDKIYLSKEDIDSIYNSGYNEGMRICKMTACPEDF